MNTSEFSIFWVRVRFLLFPFRTSFSLPSFRSTDASFFFIFFSFFIFRTTGACGENLLLEKGIFFCWKKGDNFFPFSYYRCLRKRYLEKSCTSSSGGTDWDLLCSGSSLAGQPCSLSGVYALRNHEPRSPLPNTGSRYTRGFSISLGGEIQD